MNHPKVQHYVPRFLLEHFESSPGSGQVHVYDKASSRSYVAGVHKVARENGFYDLTLEGRELTLEPSLSALEARTSGLVDVILERGEIGFLQAENKYVIARFVLAQSMRTRQFLEVVHSTGLEMIRALEARDPGSAEALGFTPDKQQSRHVALSLLQKSDEHIPILLEKAWALHEAPEEYGFWISDHPVVMNNEANRSEVRGTIGLRVPGIEIYIPLSPRFCLGMLCPTLGELIHRAYRESLAAKVELDFERPHHDEIGAMKDGLEFGFPIPSQPLNVDYVNSLQVLHAERFIYSRNGDFGMVKSMLDENPEARKGPRMRVQ